MSDKPGICLIINNKQFFDCDPREGSEKDVEMFRSLFEGLNYEVIVRENMGQKQLLDLLREKSADEELKKHDIFIAIIMSHGISEHVITSDSEYVSYDEIIDFFSNEQCKHLVGKPKVFIFNCCRSQNGKSIYHFTLYLSNHFTYNCLFRANSEFKKYKNHTEAIIWRHFNDIFYIELYANLDHCPSRTDPFAFADYLSVRDEESGTLFAKAFTTAMANNPNEDVCTIVTKANNILEELVRNDPNNRIETRQTIEQKKWGHKKNFYFSKWKH